MLNSLTSITAVETVLLKLILKQKQFIYQIARLEYRIFKNLLKLKEIETLIAEEEKNLKSVNAAFMAVGDGKIMDKLLIWKIKAEYKLFRYNLRKSKIDVVKLVLNQSKLEQLKQAFASLNVDIEKIEMQKQNLEIVVPEKEITNSSTFTFWNKMKEIQEENPINKSIKMYLQEHFQLAS